MATDVIENDTLHALEQQIGTMDYGRSFESVIVLFGMPACPTPTPHHNHHPQQITIKITIYVYVSFRSIIRGARDHPPPPTLPAPQKPRAPTDIGHSTPPRAHTPATPRAPTGAHPQPTPPQKREPQSPKGAPGARPRPQATATARPRGPGPWAPGPWALGHPCMWVSCPLSSIHYLSINLMPDDIWNLEILIILRFFITEPLNTEP